MMGDMIMSRAKNNEDDQSSRAIIALALFVVFYLSILFGIVTKY